MWIEKYRPRNFIELLSNEIEINLCRLKYQILYLFSIKNFNKKKFLDFLKIFNF
jgi:hypothetical protein